jgi:hypothetical protein
MALKNRRRIIAIISIVAVVGIIAASWAIYHNVKFQPNRGIAMNDLKALFRSEDKQLGEVIIKTYGEYRGNAVAWSAVYFGCLFGSAFFSAMAALFLKLEILLERQKLRNDLAAVLATVAALLVTLSTTGDFQRKWQANRIAASAMQNLVVDLARKTAKHDTDAILARYQEINDMRNRGIVGETMEDATRVPQSESGNAGDALPEAVK